MAAWREQHSGPAVRYVLWNDTSALALLRRFAGRGAVAAYRALKPAMRKDYFSYAVLAVHGGLFVDCDVRPLAPPGRWLLELGARGEELLLGLETRGTEEEMEQFRWGSPVQLANWALASQANSTIMHRAARSILRQHLAGTIRTDYMSQIVSTGPGHLTRVVRNELRRRGVGLEDFASIAAGGHRTDLRAGVRILGINGFGCGQPHSGSRRCADVPGEALLEHEFAGTWKWQLCSEAAQRQFAEFAALQRWNESSWYDDLCEQVRWLNCGPPAPESGLEPLRPLFAPPYPPQLPRPLPLCKLVFGRCEWELPPLLPAPPVQGQAPWPPQPPRVAPEAAEEADVVVLT
eukprot:TRINITY_DN27447_c0_g1_i1.p1 TRINITY_DN27447_c0_g1~~TRINITY_DN27447_c0_g1_i1.p1  ORF type:complete len:359 (+),score=83.71 TRINITY_DN27447_c0_g1_i1:34-1077(+)